MHAGPPTPEPLRRALTRLTAAGATGALHVAGSPCGTIWLADGEIEYAETDVMPGVGERLVGTGRLTANVWDATHWAGRTEARVGRLLVDEGHVVHGELVSRTLAAMYDAGYLLLADDEAPTRFHADLRHWLGPVARVELADLDAETARRRRLVSDVPATGTAVFTVPAVPHRPTIGPDGPAAREDAVSAAITDAEEMTAAETPEIPQETDVPVAASDAAAPSTADAAARSTAGAAGRHEAAASDAAEEPVAVPSEEAEPAADPAEDQTGPRLRLVPDVLPEQARGPWAGDGRASPNTVAQRSGNRGGNAGPHEGAGGLSAPDYATLRRIRQALKALE